jgi:hypothetical protein
MEDNFIYELNTCRLNTHNIDNDIDTSSESDEEYDDNRDNRLDEKIIIFNKNDGKIFNQENFKKEEKAIIFKKNDRIFFNEEENKYIDVDEIIENRNDIIEARPSIGCNNDIFDTSNINEYNINNFDENIIDRESYNRKNNIKFKPPTRNRVNKEYCNSSGTNSSGTNSSGTNSSGTNSSGTNNYKGIPILKENQYGILDYISNGSINFNFFKDPYNISDEEPLNNFNFKNVQDKVSEKDQEIVQTIKEGFTNYKNKNNISLIILILIIILISSICKNKNIIFIIFLFLLLLYINKDKIETFVDHKNDIIDENWIKNPNINPLLTKAKNTRKIINYKGYKYDFSKLLNKIKKFRKYNKYDYNTGLILFNKFINEIKLFNKIYCSSLINYTNTSYKSLFIDNAFIYLKDSIKHFSYIIQNINDKSIENAIMNNNFDIYQLEKRLNGLLEQLYGIGFNIVYIISRDNNYELQFDDKFLNIYSNYIYLNGPESFMEKE